MTCVSCDRSRRIHCRGLCRGCYDDRAVRDQRPDARRSAATMPVSVRNAILTDTSQVNPKLLTHLAIKAASSPRVDIDDLIQEGWLILLRSATTFDKSRKDLLHYALRGVKHAMLRYVKRETKHPDTIVSDIPIPESPDMELLVGQQVRINTPTNHRLHNTLATVSALAEWGAYLTAPAATTGQFRAHWTEMMAMTEKPKDRSDIRSMGYTGDICHKCQGSRMVRTGPCLRCDDCGETSGGCG